MTEERAAAGAEGDADGGDEDKGRRFEFHICDVTMGEIPVTNIYAKNAAVCIVLEARGVEPLSLKPLPQASTCVAGNEDSGFCCEPARYSHPIVHEFDSPAGAVNPPAN